MRDANYPALFDQAAKEFNVPADVLKGVAFAETRWEHLAWPPGETASPETGMPRPFGIMSLWDNPYFGHSLVEAAKLLGKDPEELKRNPYQNMRGGAALLRKIYDETPRPDGSPETEIESWRYAIRKYCGIPEPELNARHALDVYTFISKGYHQYGVEWNAHPVNLEKIRAETKRIVDDERLKKSILSQSNPPSLFPGQVTQELRQSYPLPDETNRSVSNQTSRPPPQMRNGQPRLCFYAILVTLAVISGSALFWSLRRRNHGENRA